MKAIRTILACIRKADYKYNLINHGDKIVVGLSGGKDSVALLYALTLYQKFSHTDFKIQPVILDLGFPGFDAKIMENYCKSLGLSLIVNDSKEVYKILLAHQDNHKHLPCSICSRMKKAAINKVANELKFNKVAFAHHADDAIETFVMNQIYGGRLATFAPKMHLERADITFIRPLSLVRESDIEKLIKEEKLPVTSSHCPADKTTTREEIKQLLNSIYKKYPESKENFLSMLSNYEKQDIWDKEISYQISNTKLTLIPVINAKQMNEVYRINKSYKYSPTTFLISKNNKPVGMLSYDKQDKNFYINQIILKENMIEIVNFISNKIGEEYNPCNIYFYINKKEIDLYSKIGYKKSPSTKSYKNKIEIYREII